MKRQRRQRGQGLVEFAVIFPIFAFLVGAVIDGGLLMGRYGNVSNAAKEGARLGAVSTDPSADLTAIVQRVKDGAQGELGSAVVGCGNAYDASNTAICVEWISGPPIGGSSQSPGELGSSIRVRIKYHYTPLTPVLNRLGGFDVSACATERIERPVDVSGVSVDASASGCSGEAAGTPTPAATDTPAPASTRTPLPTNTPRPPTATPTRCRGRECGD
ncbi:MAG TPA: TadE family protein [Dehalococcoidia bacterium]|nr:TadE family protein [Dehalococcoidia bacterium]